MLVVPVSNNAKSTKGIHDGVKHINTFKMEKGIYKAEWIMHSTF